ncbi:MAG: glycosyltransferase [Crocinitomicaceae bacterium]
MTDPLGQSQVLPYLRGLSKHGYEFHLVSFEKHEKFLKHKRHIQQICDEAGIHWHPQDYATEGGLKKTWRQVRRMRKVVNYLHEKHQFEMTHCRSYISAMIGLELKRKKGVKFLFDMRGFWADERVDGGIWDLKNPIFKKIYNYFKKKELQYFNEADHTISLTETGKEEILSWKKIKKDIEIKVIPCCVDLELFDPHKTKASDVQALKDRLGISSDKKVMGYVGSIGTWYMLPEMLDYFKAVDQNDHIFLFVTGEDPDTIYAAAKEKGINKEKIIITSCLHKDVALHIAAFDYSIFFIRPTFSKKASSPTKQGEIMAMGKPLVCNTGVGDTDRIVKRYKAGTLISEFDAQSYATAKIEPNQFDTQLIMQGAQEYFSLEEGVQRYLNVYEKING